MLQGVREDRHKTRINIGSYSQVGPLMLSGQEYRLRRFRTAVRLNPGPAFPVQGAMPQTDGSGAKCGVRDFQDNTTDILIGEEVLPGELEVIQGSFCVEEEWVASPPREEAIISGLGQARFPADRDRRAIDHNIPAVPKAGRLLAF